VLTPAVLAAVRRARVNPEPYLFACAFIANAASFVLPLSNPANLIVFGRTLPPLGPWLRIFSGASIASILVTFLFLRLFFRRELHGSMQSETDGVTLSPSGRIALLGIVVAAVALLLASSRGMMLGAPAFGVGLLAVLLVSAKDRRAPRVMAARVPWSILPLVAGLFVIVDGLNHAGLVELTRNGFGWLARASEGHARFIGSFSTALLSNLMNNLPVGLAAGSVLNHMQNAGPLTHAIVIGVDLGPNLSVTGSLATILWLIALRRENVEITPWKFLKAGMILMPVSLAACLCVLGNA
jgi:arsenical pump membrane protein